MYRLGGTPCLSNRGRLKNRSVEFSDGLCVWRQIKTSALLLHNV
ncbi:hypothetical protein [Kingella potus]|nr:hypothetical protein [Kingella potus]